MKPLNARPLRIPPRRPEAVRGGHWLAGRSRPPFPNLAMLPDPWCAAEQPFTAQARDAFFERVRGLARALEERDPWSRGHSEHVTRYALGIAWMLGLDAPEVDALRRAAQVHDVGKIGVPDGILGKPQSLTPEERRLVQQHALIAVQILDQAQCLGHEIPLVRHHHEHWDGTGYPDGIRGCRIPGGARILAVADTFDAVTSRRAYRPPRTIAEAVHVLREESGRQFDPDMVDAMLTWVERIGHGTGKAGHLAPEDLLSAPAGARGDA